MACTRRFVHLNPPDFCRFPLPPPAPREYVHRQRAKEDRECTFRPALNPVTHSIGQAAPLDELVNNRRGERVRERAQAKARLEGVPRLPWRRCAMVMQVPGSATLPTYVYHFFLSQIFCPRQILSFGSKRTQNLRQIRRQTAGLGLTLTFDQEC